MYSPNLPWTYSNVSASASWELVWMAWTAILTSLDFIYCFFVFNILAWRFLYGESLNDKSKYFVSHICFFLILVVCCFYGIINFMSIFRCRSTELLATDFEEPLTPCKPWNDVMIPFILKHEPTMRFWVAVFTSGVLDLKEHITTLGSLNPILNRIVSSFRIVWKNSGSFLRWSALISLVFLCLSLCRPFLSQSSP